MKERIIGKKNKLLIYNQRRCSTLCNKVVNLINAKHMLKMVRLKLFKLKTLKNKHQCHLGRSGAK